MWNELQLADTIQKAVVQDRSGSITLEILLQSDFVIHEIPATELILVAMWYIWWQRRQAVKGETIQTPDRTALLIKVLATNFVRANSPNQPTRKLDQIWRKPDSGIVKINVDASFHADTMAGACGAVARDEHGTFIAAASWILPHVVSADSAEIYAIRFGLILAANIGCTKIVIESYSLNALEAASNPEAYMGGDAAVITEATILAMEFSTVSCVRCCRC